MTQTLIIHTWRTTHQQILDDEKTKGGVTLGLLCVSLGPDLYGRHYEGSRAQAFAGAGLEPAQERVPTWESSMSADASDGTPYAPKPSQPKGMPNAAKADARRSTAARAQVRKVGVVRWCERAVTLCTQREPRFYTSISSQWKSNNFLKQGEFGGVNQDFTFSTVCFSQG